ncbi:MAG: DUF1192 domain-containing protein [Pseudomonadota bacterium]
MDDDLTPKAPLDLELKGLEKQDLDALSVEDLEARIAAMKAEIARCEAAIGSRQSSRAAAESVFNI